jgi:hypothetical protein
MERAERRLIDEGECPDRKHGLSVFRDYQIRSHGAGDDSRVEIELRGGDHWFAEVSESGVDAGRGMWRAFVDSSFDQLQVPERPEEVSYLLLDGRRRATIHGIRRGSGIRFYRFAGEMQRAIDECLGVSAERNLGARLYRIDETNNVTGGAGLYTINEIE